EVQRRLSESSLGVRAVLERMIAEFDRKAASAILMLFICLLAMFLTGSRAGTLSSLTALVIAFVAFLHRDLSRRKTTLLALVVVGAIALLLLQTMGAGVSGRFTATGLADGGRLATYRSTIHMIFDHPWFGTGLGAFVWSYPAFRGTDISMSGTWD